MNFIINPNMIPRMRYFDAHCHLLPQNEFSMAHAVGVEKIVCNATNPNDWQQIIALNAQDENIIPCLGIHPWQIAHTNEHTLMDLEKLLQENPQAHIGEIGLDKCKNDFYRQIEVFQAQLTLAQKYHRPVHIHSVRAWGELMPILKFHANLTFLFHGFSADAKVIHFFQNYNAFFSVKSKTKLPLIPKDKLLIESDAPDGLPSPTNIPYLYLELGVDSAQVAQNFERFLYGR